MRLFLDTNVWSYLADNGACDDLAAVAKRASVQLLVSPAIVDEARALPQPEARTRLVKAVTDRRWTRLFPESFSECEEVKREILGLRPEWFVATPKLTEVNRLRYDWVRRSGGFWDRARAEEAERETHLQHVAGIPDVGTPGWSGEPVQYWRLPSLNFFRSELLVYASPALEWIDAELDVGRMVGDAASMNRLWLHEMGPVSVPRQWLRGAFDFLQAWHKVTDGSPGDSRLATHLVEVDRFVSADKNFVRFAERCRAEAPFQVASATRIAGGRAGVDELLALIASPKGK